MRTLTPPPEPPPNLFLPPGYTEQPRGRSRDNPEHVKPYWTAERVANSAHYQAHVYRLAARLITRHALTSVLDIGCGTCAKLHASIHPVCPDITGIDQPSAIATARRLGVAWPLLTADLETVEPTPDTLAGRRYDLVLCADVLEHLVNPDPTLALIRAATHKKSIIVLSTPDRRRLRGRACLESPKPDHVREWSRREFIRLAHSRQLHVLASKLVPQDASPIRSHLAPEARFRLHLADRSPLCCHVLVCRRK